MKHTFGWSLPPGVSYNDIDNLFEEPELTCSKCGEVLDDECDDTMEDDAGFEIKIYVCKKCNNCNFM